MITQIKVIGIGYLKYFDGRKKEKKRKKSIKKIIIKLEKK